MLGLTYISLMCNHKPSAKVVSSAALADHFCIVADPNMRIGLPRVMNTHIAWSCNQEVIVELTRFHLGLHVLLERPLQFPAATAWFCLASTLSTASLPAGQAAGIPPMRW